MSDRVKVEGMKEAIDLLLGMTGAQQRGVIKIFTLKKAQVLRDALRSEVPVRTGRLRRSYRVKQAPAWVMKELGSQGRYLVFPKGGKGGGGHAWMVQKGTRERFTKSGASRGRLRANDYAGRVMGSTVPILMATGAEELVAAMNAYLMRKVRLRRM
jgi:hypothetical protein